MDALLVPPAQLRRDGIAAQQRVDGLGDVAVDCHPLAILDLDDHIEGRRRLALQDALLGAPAAGFLVAEGDALDAADQVGQRRVEHQVVEVVAVRGADELNATLGDRPGGLRLELGPDLVDDDDLRHVVLDRLDHHLVLQRWRADLHAARLADRRVRDVAVAGDLVGRVDHDDALAEVVGQHPRGLAQHRGLADAGPAHDQDRLPGLDEVVDDLDRAVDGAADPARQADDLAVPVADRADPVERALDARAVVVPERADVVDHEGDVGLGDLAIQQADLGIGEASLRATAEVEHDLDERLAIRQGMHGLDDLRRQRRQHRVEIVDRFALAFLGTHACLRFHGYRTAGTSAGSATRTRVSFMSSVTLAIDPKEASSSLRSTGPS